MNVDIDLTPAGRKFGLVFECATAARRRESETRSVARCYASLQEGYGVP